MGEISTVQVVLMGVITVFVCLVSLILITTLLSAIVRRFAPAKPAAPAVAAKPAAQPVAAPSADNRQIVAAIAVAVAEEMGTSPAHIRIHSIKRV